MTSAREGETRLFSRFFSKLISVGYWLPASNPTLYFKPSTNWNGTATFNYATIDNAGAEDTTPALVTITITPVNDAPSGSVTISGTPVVGQMLNAANTLADADGLGTITYTWRATASGTTTTLGTGSSYLLTANEVGKTITVAASYTDGQGTVESVVSAFTAAVTGGGDSTPPQVESISVEGAVVSLWFNEAIQNSNLPPTTAFAIATVASNGSVTNRSLLSNGGISRDAGNDRRLLLTLSGTAPTSSVGLRVTYNDPSSDNDPNAVQDLDGNDLASFSNRFATTFVSAVSVSSLASQYLDLVLSGSSAINGTGNTAANRITGNNAANSLSGGSGNDSLSGGGANDTMIGGAGADQLTGDAGNDDFRFALSDSLLANFDRITDLAIGTTATPADRIDGPSAVTAANLRKLGSVSALTATAIGSLLSGSTNGVANFVANGASTFTFVDQGVTRSFLALNNNTASYSATADAIIEITGFTGDINNLQVI